MEAAYAGFALLDADDGFAGCDGVGVAMAKDRNVNLVITRVADVANAISHLDALSQPSCFLVRSWSSAELRKVLRKRDSQRYRIDTIESTS